jgi:hypothetical protein
MKRERVDQADRDDGEEADDEDHRREQERSSCLAEAPQVEQRDDGQDREAYRHSGRRKRWECGRQRPDAGRDRHRDGQCVIDDQRCPSDEAHARSEVGARHRIGAAASGIGVDHLSIGEHEDGEQRDDHDRDPEHEVQRPRSGHSEDDDDRLGSVGDRGQRVEGEGREPFDRSDLLLRRFGAAQRSSDEKLPGGCANAPLARQATRHDRTLIAM